MRFQTLALTLTLAACPALRAQVSINMRIDIGLPPLPKLVVIQPGIQVVEGFHEEVFFHSGWYWCRRHNAWYRSRSPKSHFEWVEVRHVPPPLIRMPEGRYRNWHRAERHERREAERHERERARHEAERRREEERRQRMAERHERKEDRREAHRDRREDRRDERREHRRD